MVSDVRKLDVLIASPGDATPARDVVERALHEWNDHRSDVEGLVLRPRRWETASVPVLGQGDAQSIINAQLVDDADIVLGLFYHRLGSATARAISGTAEEIQRFVQAGKPVHLYFSDMPIPNAADLNQLQGVRDFKAEMQRRGLIASFASLDDLRVQVMHAIEHDIGRWLDSMRFYKRARSYEKWAPEKPTPPLEPIPSVVYIEGSSKSFPLATYAKLRIKNGTPKVMHDVRITVVIYGNIVDLPRRPEIKPGEFCDISIVNENGEPLDIFETVEGATPCRLQWSVGGKNESYSFRLKIGTMGV